MEGDELFFLPVPKVSDHPGGGLQEMRGNEDCDVCIFQMIQINGTNLVLFIELLVREERKGRLVVVVGVEQCPSSIVVGEITIYFYMISRMRDKRGEGQIHLPVKVDPIDSISGFWIGPKNR